MDTAISYLADYVPSLHKAVPLPSLALATVISKDGSSVYASSDTLFKGAVFGRDSLEVADDLMSAKPALVRNILLTLAKLQGSAYNDQNEEQPGKIIHEYRTARLNGKPIDQSSLRILQELSHKWGGNSQELAYYGSVDATPHFLRTLGRYCQAYGDDILDKKVVQRNGQTASMRQVAEMAVTWLLDRLDASASGMLEYRKVNPLGISNQVWKDSEEFYVHENGLLANHEQPIASIEVQGLAYDALGTAAALFPKRAEQYRARAHKLRDQTITLLWQPAKRYFALGIDYNPEGELRVIATTTANPAALLDTGFFDELSDDRRRQYVTAIVERIISKDFLTNAGIRSRSLDMGHLLPFWDYHGSYVTWPKETYDIAKGLRRQGFIRLERQLENRLLNLVLKTREYPEFVYVDGWGRLLTGPPSAKARPNRLIAEGTNKPERLQAWTASALMAIITGRSQTILKRQPRHTVEPWQIALEDQLMARIPHMDFHLNPLKLWLQYPTYKYHLVTRQET